MKLFDIPNHPLLADITRKAEVTFEQTDFANKQMTLYLRILHYLNGVYISELDKRFPAVMNNDSQIILEPEIPEEKDEEGNITQEFVPAVTIGEFDYWEAGAAQGAGYIAMWEAGIAQMVLGGVIDTKAAYKTE